MGKYDLGVSNSKISENIKKDKLYVNEEKAKVVVDDINHQLNEVKAALSSLYSVLNKSVSSGVVSGTRKEVFRGWAKKCKSQVLSTERMKNKLFDQFYADVNNYPIKLLDSRIIELEKKIASMNRG